MYSCFGLESFKVCKLSNSFNKHEAILTHAFQWKCYNVYMRELRSAELGDEASKSHKIEERNLGDKISAVKKRII